MGDYNTLRRSLARSVEIRERMIPAKSEHDYWQCFYLMFKSIFSYFCPTFYCFSAFYFNPKLFWQGCSPRDRGLGLESTRDRFFPVLVLVLVLRPEILVLVLVLILAVLVLVSKGRS